MIWWTMDMMSLVLNRIEYLNNLQMLFHVLATSRQLVALILTEMRRQTRISQPSFFISCTVRKARARSVAARMFLDTCNRLSSDVYHVCVYVGVCVCVWLMIDLYYHVLFVCLFACTSQTNKLILEEFLPILLLYYLFVPSICLPVDCSRRIWSRECFIVMLYNHCKQCGSVGHPWPSTNKIGLLTRVTFRHEPKMTSKCTLTFVFICVWLLQGFSICSVEVLSKSCLCKCCQ